MYVRRRKGVHPYQLDRYDWGEVLAELKAAIEERGDVFFKRTRRAWAVHKFNKSENKKIYSFSLSIESNDKLDELATHHNTTRSEILTKLIDKGVDTKIADRLGLNRPEYTPRKRKKNKKAK